MKKYNEGSSAFCMCENIERPLPIFQRMFISLKPGMDGFKAGCRPLIGLDGCHLTGPYPGICLVAMASDGNNNIYPLAWGVRHLVMVIGPVSFSIGNSGWTWIHFHGLLEAFQNVVPKAGIRFCWRHIWSNFKLKWNGLAYKELLWKAAKATTVLEFNEHMQKLKTMSEKAYEYMSVIPSHCWNRHAFSSTPKSKMLLNNTCESFNNVLKQARDKPILTHVEWMRRYVMQRNCQKLSEKLEFNEHMQKLKTMSEKAYEYMSVIPSHCWNRHAFSSTPKSKMLLNNTCESFNNVLKQARDKPILTHVEWMRRYVMQRNCQKREGAQKMQWRFMPYVNKQFDWAERTRKYKILTGITEVLFEVENNGDRHLVDLNAWKCSCYSWQLIGIPCHYAYACILYMRGDPDEDYVDAAYSRDKYLAAYTAVLMPMPGLKQWEKTSFPEPLPPPFKVMPSRPSKKKRKKEVGEDAERAADLAKKAARMGGKPYKCSNCMQYGHNIKRCKNPTLETSSKPKNKGGKPFSDDPWMVHSRAMRVAEGK
ncbi:uncharacterized protein LOC110688589 [Chenopodium quinoa]|uniref:uncharacterized protein LOC110688589 n=1 Tax=Chenopodium quinoa TaxID=63459 RepID=UPI000B7972E4|nr:uncharacterized protein LOC110688589 [Chenopodium quinoa]